MQKCRKEFLKKVLTGRENNPLEQGYNNIAGNLTLTREVRTIYPRFRAMEEAKVKMVINVCKFRFKKQVGSGVPVLLHTLKPSLGQCGFPVNVCVRSRLAQRPASQFYA